MVPRAPPNFEVPSPDEDESPRVKETVEAPPISEDPNTIVPPSSGRGPGRVEFDLSSIGKRAPIVISEGNIYVVWWNNNTGNDEIMFRTSTDGGTTFADKIDLSNSTDTESQEAEISAAGGGNVVVTLWERNATGGNQ